MVEVKSVWGVEAEEDELSSWGWLWERERREGRGGEPLGSVQLSRTYELDRGGFA